MLLLHSKRYRIPQEKIRWRFIVMLTTLDGTGRVEFSAQLFVSGVACCRVASRRFA